MDDGYLAYSSFSDTFIDEIKDLIESFTIEEQDVLILEWKTQKNRIQLESNEFYINQYKVFTMEELVPRALKLLIECRF